MNKLIKRGLLGLAAVAVPASAVLALPMAANASPSTVTAVTHSSNHPDTTSLPASDLPGATIDLGNGPVWAYDNLSIKFSATPETTAHTYQVDITLHGNFDAFANPNNGQAYTGSGSVDGTISYDVASSTGPDAQNLPAQVPGSDHLSDMLNRLFDGHITNIGGGDHYTFTYNQIDGQRYSQTAA